MDRFNVKEIGEFYGATEGNIAFWNYWGRGEPHGAIGETMLDRTCCICCIIMCNVKMDYREGGGAERGRASRTWPLEGSW